MKFWRPVSSTRSPRFQQHSASSLVSCLVVINTFTTTWTAPSGPVQTRQLQNLRWPLRIHQRHLLARAQSAFPLSASMPFLALHWWLWWLTSAEKLGCAETRLKTMPVSNQHRFCQVLLHYRLTTVAFTRSLWSLDQMSHPRQQENTSLWDASIPSRSSGLAALLLALLLLLMRAQFNYCAMSNQFVSNF